MILARQTFWFLAVLCLQQWAWADLRSELRVTSDSFISPSFEATNQSNYQFIGARVVTTPKSNDPIHFNIDGAGAVSSPLLNYLNIVEIYYGSDSKDDPKYSIGRKLEVWSDLDRRWNFSLIEPVFRWNPLNRTPQGLTGFFWQTQRDFWEVTLFASPFFFPDQGPSYELENGQFVRGNPWFRRPPDSIRIYQETSSVEYEFDKPAVSQVVMQTSYGGRVLLGSNQGPQARMSYFFKPMNQLALGYDGNFDISKFKGTVTIFPQVMYHSIGSMDLAYRANGFGIGGSLVYDSPSKDKIFEDRWTYPTIEPAVLSSLFAEMKWKRLNFSTSLLQVQGGKITEVGELASPSRPSITSRYPYRQAYQVGAGLSQPLGGPQRLNVETKYTWSDENDFRLFGLSSRYDLSTMWSLTAEVLLIDSGETNLDNQNEIDQFRNHDRMTLGVNYVF